MKLLFDFLPILIFFLAFKLGGIFVATGAFLAASAIQMGVYWYMHRRFEQIHIITFILGLVLGGATLFLHNMIFIKWKPTAIYWAFALVFFVTQYVGEKTLIERMMGNNLSLPKLIWQRLNLSWGIFFTFLGFLNLYVVYHFSTDAWVNFKVFGMLGLTLIFVILQAVYLSRYIKTSEDSKS